jgi:hypothetical protein
MHYFPAWTIEPTRILTRRELGAVLADLKRQAPRSANARRNLVIVRLACCIAKAAGPSLTERTLHTSFGALVGTPEYMSPEQATSTSWTSTPAAMFIRWAFFSTSY